ncbi:unnamed protein product [Paramecium octaurelia]|uniref:Uncharacterized protein n=1 Tax=Paramecium octaurelia TaxID=43137 RepID=A0A8S1U9C3_PAROT|nr:unnamed protein product [Paramecium octaurelia]
MIEISISQISLKQALGNCQINIGIKCGERKEILYQQFSSTQKIIKYSQPHQYVFDTQNTKFLQFYIETPDEQGYIKLLGSSKLLINDVQGREVSHKIELEHSNIMNLVLRCTAEVRNSAKQIPPMNNRIDNYHMMSVNKSEPIINKKRYGSPQPNKNQPSRSPQHKKLPPQPQPQPVVLQQQQQQQQFQQQQQQPQQQVLQPTSSNLSKSSASSIKHQKILEDYKQVMQNSILDESEEFQNSPDHRMDPPQPIMEFQKNNTTPRQSSKQIEEIQLAQYKQMVKELSLLLDVQQDCDSIVYAVQQLLQKYRGQNEQIMKIQCENQILFSQYNSLQQQKSIIESKTDEFKNQIKSKLKTYKSLFDENVQLKNQLKEDLQKIVDLNIQIRELKGDQLEKQQIDSEIQHLKQQIDKVTMNVDQKSYDYAILTEEINLIQYNV